MLNYTDSEKDLGVLINPNFSFTEQCESLLSKANQQYGLVKRTCNFVRDMKRRRALYLSLIRSQFEHCSPIWRPCNHTLIERFENFQKKCIKWILSEEELSYGSHETYVRKCRQTNILPLALRFDLNDLTLFHKIVNNYIPVVLPEYLSWYSGNSRLRTSHLDHLSLVCSLLPNTSSSKPLEKSFFYRTHSSWNALPLELRQIGGISEFRNKLENHLWKSVTDSNEHNSSFQSDALS